MSRRRPSGSGRSSSVSSLGGDERQTEWVIPLQCRIHPPIPRSLRRNFIQPPLSSRVPPLRGNARRRLRRKGRAAAEWGKPSEEWGKPLARWGHRRRDTNKRDTPLRSDRRVRDSNRDTSASFVPVISFTCSREPQTRSRTREQTKTTGDAPSNGLYFSYVLLPHSPDRKRNRNIATWIISGLRVFVCVLDKKASLLPSFFCTSTKC